VLRQDLDRFVNRRWPVDETFFMPASLESAMHVYE